MILAVAPAVWQGNIGLTINPAQRVVHAARRVGSTIQRIQYTHTRITPFGPYVLFFEEEQWPTSDLPNSVPKSPLAGTLVTRGLWPRR